MEEYLNIFIDDEYPKFLDKYLTTKTLERLKYITQFCGCDYTNLYKPLFLYTRFDHSLVVAHMTWHFTHDKKETIVSLLHDVGTPCFAHCIDYVFNDYINQESSEKKISVIVKKDKKLLKYLEEDNIKLEELEDFKKFHILENKTPKLCTDRLDGVLHSCYIWLHTHSINEIEEVYNNLIVLENEDKNKELGFKDIKIADKFTKMVYNYAKELQGNTDKYIMKYISEIVKLAVDEKLISVEDLYKRKEKDLCKIFSDNFTSWNKFNNADKIICTNLKPYETFFISFDTKKRNVIPLVKLKDKSCRIDKCSIISETIYKNLNNYSDKKFAYIDSIKNLK